MQRAEAMSEPIETAEDWYALKTLPQRAGRAEALPPRYIEAMSNTTKTAKGGVATKTRLQWAANVLKA